MISAWHVLELLIVLKSLFFFASCSLVFQKKLPLANKIKSFGVSGWRWQLSSAV